MEVIWFKSIEKVVVLTPFELITVVFVAIAAGYFLRNILDRCAERKH